MSQTCRTLVCMGIGLSFLAEEVGACSVPVFRYALERWAADWYEIDIFYRGELSAADCQRLDDLEDRCVPNGGAANLEVVRVNLEGQPAADLLELWKSVGDVPLPHFVVRMPKGGPIVGSGPLADLDGKSLLDSPARREIARRLAAGHSTVWLLIGPEKSPATDDARKLLKETLPKLAEEIALPAGVGQPGSELLSPAPLSVNFSWIEIDPADAAETWLVQMLKAHRAKDIPPDDILVVAAFGRGRVADVFGSQDLNRELLSDVSEFLCGACSCQVKQLNPGFDLLTSTPWEERLFSGDAPPPFEPPATNDDANAIARLVPIPKGMPAEPFAMTVSSETTRPSPSPTRRGPLLWGFITLGLTALLFSAACAHRQRHD